MPASSDTHLTDACLQGMKVKVDMYSDGSLMDEVMQLMLQAEKHSGGDPGVQVC